MCGSCGGVLSADEAVSLRSAVAVASHLSVRSLCLVAGQVEATKHLLSATFAPMSTKYCLDRRIPCTAVEACLSLAAYRNRSSARTLGTTLCALMYRTHGLIRRAVRAMEKGHPCGMELLW